MLIIDVSWRKITASNQGITTGSLRRTLYQDGNTNSCHHLYSTFLSNWTGYLCLKSQNITNTASKLKSMENGCPQMIQTCFRQKNNQSQGVSLATYHFIMCFSRERQTLTDYEAQNNCQGPQINGFSEWEPQKKFRGPGNRRRKCSPDNKLANQYTTKQLQYKI